ncbi:LysE family translocator [Pseudomonas gingeri]|uniref:LysE family translocator n=1 Tax=Pseudomonas gingeri TaxID=117681 RepID=A0A7Y7WS52_9PSED|nr:LysE family translocator [Pseudomonas gingeri]NWB86744.1 LysE family translocator [Pseudomonas gingeri]
MNLSLLLLYLLSISLLIVTPGPVVALLVNTSLGAGSGRALLTMLGTNGASLVLALLAALILSGGLSLNLQWINVVSLSGCLFIGYLGVKSLQEALSTAVDDGVQATRSERRTGFVNGFLVGISNPKEIIFFVSFFPQFIQVTPSFGHSVALLAVLWAVIDLAAMTFYILLARQAFAVRHKAKITFASGTLLLMMAIFGVLYAARALLSSLN